MTREEIMNILPHRNSMLLLDEVEKVGDEAHGKYTVKGTEFFLDGHFPSFPIVPGVILCEILAQSACVLLDGTISSDKLPVYAGLDKVRFRSPVRPGDTFETKCRITRSKGPFYFGEGEGYVDGNLAISASFSFCITDKESVCSQKS
ncbi:MAG: beta-hydroxyacyl-ACP dehydratase [Spirochaetes bacterium]|uniref:Beta-hydroxyacyl-ACP dehydratase n=1 Tax=Candidatus Ornithospirochaeta stercoripullorum TaxID=2840899 RepID=A0A9D9H664_9SPIO|nr:beta-hydroxyacyl-ACP dehydratase [Candidatus Ornithospirochaeta stercoripullorum]